MKNSWFIHYNFVNFKKIFRNYTYKPRLTGTENEKDLVDELYNTWKENGLHKVIRTPYKVLLSYPNTSMPNKVNIFYMPSIFRKDKLIF